MVSLLMWPVAWTRMAGRGWLGDIIFSLKKKTSYISDKVPAHLK